ncbi:hypothetical protein CSPX01_01928, partial [Colletotrichum filicis]
AVAATTSGFPIIDKPGQGGTTGVWDGQVLGKSTTCRRAPTAPIRRRNSRSTCEGAWRTPLLSASNSTVRPHPTLPIPLPQPGRCIQTKLAKPPSQSYNLGSDPSSNRVQMSPYQYQVCEVPRLAASKRPAAARAGHGPPNRRPREVGKPDSPEKHGLGDVAATTTSRRRLTCDASSAC